APGSRTRSRPLRWSSPAAAAPTSPGGGGCRTAACSWADMPDARELSIRGTPIHLLREGSGPALLFLHGAGGAGRWLLFQERLARCFKVYSPTPPGDGGSPAAEWIEHISDLAFHYLDVLDTLGLERAHLVGASFGGWIAAEIATMASHRLQSLVLIDPVGIRVDG